MPPIKVAFVGDSDNFESYLKALMRFEDIEFTGTLSDNKQSNRGHIFNDIDELLSNNDAVFFFGEKVRKKYLLKTIKAVKHIFIENYTAIMNNDIYEYQKLTSEAEIIAQISFPKIYFWGIKDLANEYPRIRNIFIFREYIYQQYKIELDLVPEILSAIKLVGDEVIRIQSQKMSLINKRTEIQNIQLEFKTGATTSITGIPVGFSDIHELRIIAERSLAYVDLRKREWHSLKPARTLTGNLVKGLAGLPEIGDIEHFEIQDFILSIQEQTEAFVSFNDIASLYHCLKMEK